MTTPRILIVGSSYVADEPRRELTKIWYRLVKQLNPGIDLWLVDTASPFDPSKFLPHDFPKWRFADNPGAISQGQRDGSGRAFCKCLEIGVENHYDYVVPWETDLLFVLPIVPIVAKMHRSGVQVAAPWALPFQFPEWGICFWSTEYIRESRFIERYDWEHTPKWPIPEFRISHLTNDRLFILPINGWRNHGNEANVGNLQNFFPYGPPAFITQCRDFQLYYRFLDMNRISLVEEAA